MINLCILLAVPLQSLYTMIRSFVIYLRDRNRLDARYLLGWSICTIIAMVFITGEVEVEGKPTWLTAELSPWGWVVYNVFLNLGVLGMIYHGVGFSMVLTSENLKNLRRCQFFLGLTLLVMTFLDALYEVGEMPVAYRLYGLAFLPASLGYNGKIIYAYMTRAKNAKPLTKWRMRFSKWGCIFCGLTIVELLISFKAWPVRPGLVLLLVAWTLFTLSGVTPSWLQHRIVATSVAPKLFNDARFMWQHITDRGNPNIELGTRLPGPDKTRSLDKRLLNQNHLRDAQGALGSSHHPQGLPSHPKDRIAFWFSGALKLQENALFLLTCVTDCYNRIVHAEGRHLEKWINPWAKRFHLSERQTSSLIRATYLEVGWFWVDDKILSQISENSPEPISEEILLKEDSSEHEREIRWWQNVASMLRQTTERWDGNGSPNGLAGEEIPIESRLLKVISGFVAKWQTTEDARGLPSHPKDTDVAIAHIRAGAGTQFDPRLVDALEKMAQESWRF